jgi:hypothetical protein
MEPTEGKLAVIHVVKRNKFHEILGGLQYISNPPTSNSGGCNPLTPGSYAPGCDGLDPPSGFASSGDYISIGFAASWCGWWLMIVACLLNVYS